MGEANLNSPAFNDAAADDIISRCMTRIAKRFRKDTQDKQAYQTAQGRYYPSRVPGQGAGFTRYHRASARGQRPQPDTRNLLESVKDEKQAPLTHRVYVDDVQAPYGKYLQENLDRPIATKEDAEAFVETAVVKADIERTKQELINGVTGSTL